MKILRLFVVLSALFCAVVAPSPARAQGDVSFDFFYDSLAPYGDWIRVGDYGLCWTPTNVDPDWSPYSDGYWAYTDAGWTWVSYEDFGGIVYHYGRWIHLDDGRWCWMPDSQWAPCWVSWRHSRDYIGWAPLPPEARWRRDVGFSIWVDDVYDIGPGRYSFCHPRDFGAPVLRGVIINRDENLTCMRETVNVTNITYNTDFADGPVIFDGGPSFEVINEVSARPIPTLKLVLDPGFDPARWREHRGPGGRVAFNAHTVGNQLIVAAPLVTPPADLSAFKAHVKTVIPAKKVNNGWSTVKNPDQFRQEFRQQLKGVTPESAARPVAAADLRVVPAKGDPHASPVAGGDRREKSGKGQRPESIVTQPNNVPPGGPSTAGNPLLKPFNAVTEPGQKPRSQNTPGTPFTPNPRGVTSTDPGAGGNNHPRSNDDAQKERAAEQAKIRAEEERISQQKQIPFQQEGRKMQAEENRRRELEKQQQFQQQQFQIASNSKPSSSAAWIPARRRRPSASGSTRSSKSRPSTRRSRNRRCSSTAGNQPPSPNGSPQPGNKGHSKDSKDKDKDKDKNGN